MEKLVYKGFLRSQRGSRAACRERAEGLIPAVLYGRKDGGEPIHFSLQQTDVGHMLRHNAKLVELELDNKVSETGLIRDVQFDPVSDQVLHIDLVHIDLTEKVQVEVELDFIGHPKGLSAGGKFTHDLADLPVECLPSAIPENIPVRVSHLELGDNLLVKDLEMPKGVAPTVPPETMVCHVKAFLETTEVEEQAEGETAEPEVITKKAEPEEKED